MASNNVTRFDESDYQFEFSDQWKVLKYDSHPYYKIVSGRSFSGVDFAGIIDNHLYLMEIKNFYQYNQNGQIEDISIFCEDMKEKFLDTIDLIRIIQKYHERKWTYRLFYKVVESYPSLHLDWWFWTSMQRYVKAGSFTFILCVLAAIDMEGLQEKIARTIRAEYDEDFHIQLESLQQIKMEGLTVRPSIIT